MVKSQNIELLNFTVIKQILCKFLKSSTVFIKCGHKKAYSAWILIYLFFYTILTGYWPIA